MFAGDRRFVLPPFSPPAMTLWRRYCRCLDFIIAVDFPCYQGRRGHDRDRPVNSTRLASVERGAYGGEVQF